MNGKFYAGRGWGVQEMTASFPHLRKRTEYQQVRLSSPSASLSGSRHAGFTTHTCRGPGVSDIGSVLFQRIPRHRAKAAGLSISGGAAAREPGVLVGSGSEWVSGTDASPEHRVGEIRDESGFGYRSFSRSADVCSRDLTLTHGEDSSEGKPDIRWH